MNSLIVYKENIWNNLKKYFVKFINLFKKESREEKNIVEQIGENDLEKKEKMNLFKQSLQNDIKNEQVKKDLFDSVEKNFELIYTLPDERLNQLSKIYDEKISELKAEIEKKRLMISKKKYLLVDENM